MAPVRQRTWPVLPLAVCMLVQVFGLVVAEFDIYRMNTQPVTYEGYNRQCGYQNQCYGDFECPNLQDLSDLEKQALEQATFELLTNEAISNDPRYLIGNNEFDSAFFQTRAMIGLDELGVRRTLTTQKVLEAMAQRYSFCQIRNLLDGRCYSNLTLPSCKGNEQPVCDPNYPFRSYDGSCNNLQNPTWGRRGNALKHPIAPCFSDGVSKPAVSKSGGALPQNRKLISELSQFLEQRGPNIQSEMNMFLVFFSEFVNSDMIGRANKRTRRATDGYRGCKADGSTQSEFVSKMSNPLLVLPDDRYFGRLGVGCLNYSPQEKSNDRCELKHVGERNMDSSYLDLSSMYSHAPVYDSVGKLPLNLCGATASIMKSEPATIQFMAVAGLFANLHNYCVDRAGPCLQNGGPVQERCRALTTAIYQKIIYEDLLPFLFGETLYKLCGLDCQYNPYVESTVSQVYKNGPGRFQHVWIPDFMLYEPQGRSELRPFNEFFHNHESFDCTGSLAGVIKTRIQIGRLVDASVNKFYTEDGKRGTCLPCIDLARNRDSGLCPLVVYKHFIEQLIGEETKCYEKFEDLSDMFRPELLQFFKEQYGYTGAVDVLFANMDRRFYPGARLPKLVSQSTCLEFKRLKCTDRFFYTWNPYLGEGARHLIKAFDFTALLALFTEMTEVPLQPFVVNGPRVASYEVRSYIKTLDYLFCTI